MTTYKKQKLIELITVHVLVIFILCLIGYLIYDKKIYDNKIEECKKICYPDKVVETMSMRKCICYEEERTD